MTLQDERILGQDAKAILENPVVKQVFKRLEDHVNSKILSCDPDNKEATQRAVITRQILFGIRREFEKLVQDGEVAEIQLNEMEVKKPFMKVIRR